MKNIYRSIKLVIRRLCVCRSRREPADVFVATIKAGLFQPLGTASQAFMCISLSHAYRQGLISWTEKRDAHEAIHIYLNGAFTLSGELTAHGLPSSHLHRRDIYLNWEHRPNLAEVPPQGIFRNPAITVGQRVRVIGKSTKLYPSNCRSGSVMGVSKSYMHMVDRNDYSARVKFSDGNEFYIEFGNLEIVEDCNNA